MDSVARLLARLVARRPLLTLITITLLTLGLAGLAGQSEISNDASAFSPDTEEVMAQEVLTERFADETTALLQVVVAAEEGGDVVSAEGAETVAVVTELAQDTLGEGVADPRAVQSFLLPAEQAARQVGEDLSALSDQEVDQYQELGLSAQPAGSAAPGGAEALVQQLLSGEDPTSSSSGIVLLQIEQAAFGDDAALNQAQQDFAGALEDADTPLEAVAFSSALLASPDDDFGSEIARLFGIAAVVIIVTLALVLRARTGAALSWFGALRRTAADTALAMGAVLIAIVWNQGIGVLLGPDYLGVVGVATPPTQVVPIILLALGVDYSIHLHSRYREDLQRFDPVEAAARIGRTVGVALLLSMVTTGIGFLSNLVSPVPSIRDLGILATTGIVAVFLTTATVVPAGRLLLDRLAARRGRPHVTAEVAPRDTALLSRFATASVGPITRFPGVIVAVAVVLTSLGGWGLTQLPVEFDTSAFLPEGSATARAFEILDEDFDGGLGETTEVLITGPDVLTPESHNALAEVPTALAGVDGIVQSASAADVRTPVTALADAQRSTDPDVTAAIDEAQALGLQPDGTVAEDADVAEIYTLLSAVDSGVAAAVDIDGTGDTAIRLTARTQSTDVGSQQIRDSIDGAVEPVRAAGASAVVTSQQIISDDVTALLADSVVVGLIATLGIVMVLMALVYGLRSGEWLLGVIVLSPVIFVTLSVFGLMYLTDIPFDIVTAIISALIVGVSVDFCIHLGERFVEDVKEADSVEDGVRSALRHTGAALAGSAATSTFGFGVLTVASIVPFQRLGLVTVYAMVLSLIATLWVLPAMLVMYQRRRHARVAAQARPVSVTADPRHAVEV